MSTCGASSRCLFCPRCVAFLPALLPLSVGPARFSPLGLAMAPAKFMSPGEHAEALVFACVMTKRSMSVRRRTTRVFSDCVSRAPGLHASLGVRPLPSNCLVIRMVNRFTGQNLWPRAWSSIKLCCDEGSAVAPSGTAATSSLVVCPHSAIHHSIPLVSRPSPARLPRSPRPPVPTTTASQLVALPLLPSTPPAYARYPGEAFPSGHTYPSGHTLPQSFYPVSP